MKSLLLQLGLSFAFCVMQDVDCVQTSGPTLASLIKKTCRKDKYYQEIMVVSVMQADLARLNLNGRELRLLGSGSDCRPVKCCDRRGWMWKFSIYLCGNQRIIEEGSEIVTNVLYVDRQYSHRNGTTPLSEMAVIACSYPVETDSSGSGLIKKNDDITMPTLKWSLYRTEYFDDMAPDSAAITSSPSTYVGNWTEGGWISLLVEPKDNNELYANYNDKVLLTVERCSLNFVSEDGGPVVKVKTILDRGCPTNLDDCYFGDGEAWHANGVGIAFYIRKEAYLLAASDTNVTYAYLKCSASLCRDPVIKRYIQLPKCQGYHHSACFRPLEWINRSFVGSFQSGLLTLKDPGPAAEDLTQTVTTTQAGATTTQPTTSSSVASDIVVIVAGNSADALVELPSFLVAVICVACFVCTSCTLIGVCCLIRWHKHRIASLQVGNASQSMEEVQRGKEVIRCDKSSLDSGTEMPDSSLSSPL